MWRSSSLVTTTSHNWGDRVRMVAIEHVCLEGTIYGCKLIWFLESNFTLVSLRHQKTLNYLFLNIEHVGAWQIDLEFLPRSCLYFFSKDHFRSDKSQFEGGAFPLSEFPFTTFHRPDTSLRVAASAVGSTAEVAVAGAICTPEGSRSMLFVA